MTTVQTQGIALAKVKFVKLKATDTHKSVSRRFKPLASASVDTCFGNTIAISFQIMTRAEPVDMVKATIQSSLIQQA